MKDVEDWKAIDAIFASRNHDFALSDYSIFSDWRYRRMGCLLKDGIYIHPSSDEHKRLTCKENGGIAPPNGVLIL